MVSADWVRFPPVAVVIQTTYYLVLSTYYVPLTTYYSLLTTYYLLFTIYYPRRSGHPDGSTPSYLLGAGLYAQIAIAMKGGEYRHVSMAMLAEATYYFLQITTTHYLLLTTYYSLPTTTYYYLLTY